MPTVRPLSALFIAAPACVVALAAAPSQAHFRLVSPAAVTTQNQLGDPQKAPPCGDNGTATPTGAITTVQEGGTITVTIDETITHPGHYRIALAVDDISELPPPPPVTPGQTPCGSAPIDENPQFPVLADGVFVHTQTLSGPQSIEITLPEGVTCSNCTLQVIEFMANHGLNNPGGCYYHHCAALAIEAAGDDSDGSSTTGADTTQGNVTVGDSSPPDGNTSTGTMSATEEDTLTPSSGEDGGGGCGCTLHAQPGGREGLLASFAGLAGLFAMRRRLAFKQR